MGFEGYNPNALTPPLNGTFGELMASTLGAQQDAEISKLVTALKCRLPAKCPADALDTLGRTFRIERYPDETDDVYRGRLEAAFATWEIAGSPDGVIGQLQDYGFVDVQCVENPDFHGGPGYGLSRCWLVLGPDFGTLGISELYLDAWTLGATTLGSTATRSQVIAVKKIVLKWAAAWANPVRVLLIFDGAAHLGLSITLGTWTLGGGSDPVRWPMARTLADTNETLGFVLGGYEV